MSDPGLRKIGTRVAGVAVALIVIASTWFVFGQLWPVYDFAAEVPSPDGRYVIAVIRGEKAAFDDFFYRVYVFPEAVAPLHLKRGERVWMRGSWADHSYLVYAGYSVPSLRWTSGHEIEIDLDDLYEEVREFNPTPALHEPRRDRSSAILASLIFNKSDARNLSP